MVEAGQDAHKGAQVNPFHEEPHARVLEGRQRAVKVQRLLGRVIMSCYICGINVAPIVLPDVQEITCPNCGRYRISGTAIELLERHPWKFDIYLARRWIADQQGDGTVPLIDSDIVTRLVYV